MTPFNARLKAALGSAADSPLVLLGNFEVEETWAVGETTLPRMSSEGGTAIVNRMDELALWLGGPDDHVVLKTAPDPDFLDHLVELGTDLPTVHAVRAQSPANSVTEDVLADPDLLRRLSALAVPRDTSPTGAGPVLVAHGTSHLEERVAAATGIPLGGSPADTCRAVNSKVFSRRLADKVGLGQPRGFACDTLDEWPDVVAAASELLVAGPVVVKEALGVSGKGIAVAATQARLDRLARVVRQRAETNGGRMAFCVEQWVDKATDLNYQFTLSRDGGVHFDFVKEALTESGVHRGHVFPARISTEHSAAVRDAAERIGHGLAAEGYVGVVGVDALVETDGTLHPLLEINARNNMSTYQLPLQERLVGDGQTVLARHYPTESTRPLRYAQVRAALGDLAYTPGRGEGVVVMNFATVNAGFAGRPGDQPGTGAAGRLYVMLIADSGATIDRLDHSVAAALGRLTGHGA